MGAAGFEPATTWSEAKHSIQTELSARTARYFGEDVKSRDSQAPASGTLQKDDLSGL